MTIERAPVTLDYDAIAARLLDDHTSARRFAPFAKEYGIRNLDDAYAAQGAYVKLRAARLATDAAGYKIGLTSKTMQAMCGLATPVAGMVLANGVHVSPATIPAKTHGRLGLEFEIAVRLARDVDDPAHVVEAIGGVAPAVELVDDRGCDYRALDALSLVADNAWNAGVVHGEFVAQWPELADVEGVALANGAEIGRGFGRDVLGHPFAALTWLAKHLAERGQYLRAGDIVSTGSLIPTHFPTATTNYSYAVDGLGEISCRVVF
jgi:2-keto-4-pentenoate hydratase